ALGVRFLTLTYLSALCVGYCSGYLLLLFSGRTDRVTPKLSGFSRFLNGAVTGAVWVLLLLAPALLLYRNFPQIKTTNGPILKQYAASMLQKLPPGKVFLLADPDASAN